MATSLELTSTGELRCTMTGEDVDLPLDVSERIRQAFAVGTARGLLHLATAEMGIALPPALAWWREFACRFLSQLCRSPLAATHSADKRQMKALLRKAKHLHALIALSKMESHIRHIPPPEMGSHNILLDRLNPSKEREREEAMKEAEKYLCDSRDPAKLPDRPADPDLLATLRPYQETGVGWLWFMSNLSLGACLADDMGLGKTIQVLALLLRLKREAREADPEAVPPLHLLVVPAS